jgi:hypothetical protein
MPLVILIVPRKTKKVKEYRMTPRKEVNRIGRRWKKNCNVGKIERMPQISPSGPYAAPSGKRIANGIAAIRTDKSHPPTIIERQMMVDGRF